jgi:hypothetical protein
MTISPRLRDRIKDVAAHLRRELYGEQGFPEWGTQVDGMARVVAPSGAVACSQGREPLGR